VRLLAESVHDCRYAIRQLFQRGSSSMITIVILGIGIGATTAIFSVVNSLMLRPLPVREPQRLVMLSTPFRANAGLRTVWSFAIWEQIRRNAQLFDGALAWSAQHFNLSQRGEAEPVSGLFASGDYFMTLGVPAVIGRTFTAADDVRGGGPDGLVAVISYGLWQRRYNSAADVVGQPLRVDGATFTIVGVMPRGFFGTEVGRNIDVALPLAAEPSIHATNPALDAPDWYWLSVMLRLKSGQSLDQVNTALRAIGGGIIQNAIMPADLPAQFVPQLRNDPFVATSGITGISSARAQYNRPLSILLATAAVLLLIACANVANLMLARAISRRYEITVRLALGASRWRLVRQTVTESFILSFISAAVGLSIAGAGSRLLVSQLSGTANPVSLELSLDWRVMVFTVRLAIATATLFGMVPAWTGVRVAPIDVLKERSRITSRPFNGLLSSGLVAGQIALSLVLLVIAGLFIGTFTKLADVQTGYDTNHIDVFEVNLRHAPADPAQRLALFRDLVRTAGAAPGVSRAAGSFVTPISDSGFSGAIESSGFDMTVGRGALSFINFVTPGWFETYGMSLRGGRDFNDSDIIKRPDVAVVNDAFVRRFFPDSNPIGQTVKFSSNSRDFSKSWTIVGVVSNAVYQSPREGMQPTLYLPLTQWEESALFSDISIAVRSPGDRSAAVTRAVADALTRVDGDVSFTVNPLANRVHASLARESAIAKVSTWFGVMALVLAAFGLYGVMSYAINRRRAEIGIRAALGATPGVLMRMIFRRAYLLVAIGIAVGTFVSSWAAGLVASLWYGIDSHDTFVLALSAFVLTIAATVAVWLPASRAARTDPALVLRSE
jgi:putative ABC transport system permease protein